MVEIRYQGLTLDGRYQMRHCLDKGSFGAVYEAVDLRFDSTVAVKILFEEKSDTATAFRKEARLAREFRHPHVVTVFDYGTDAKLNVGYIVMEFLQGRRLDYVMSDRSSPVPDRVIAQFADQIGWALQSAHERDLIHRDVKPRNVMLVDEGTSSERFVLLDLGLASKTNSTTTLRNQTHDGALSPNYASPEQINQGTVDYRSDIYSFGTVLYQMVTGVIPFPRDNFLYTMTAICRDPVPRFAEVVPHRVVPADLQDVVKECLEKQPDARPPSIQEVRQRVLVALGFGSGYYSVPPLESEGTIPKVLPQPSPAVTASTDDTAPGDSGKPHVGEIPSHTQPPIWLDGEGSPCPNPMAATVIPAEVTNSIGMRLKLIPAGRFLMGSPQSEAGHWPDEGPQHRVEISRPFYLGVFPVTQEQYEHVTGRNPSKFRGADHPVERVTWDEAVEYCRRLSELPEEKSAGHMYRLPTESEWEYACRAGTTTAYSFGDSESELTDSVWYAANSQNATHPPGEKTANPLGLHDMHGNVCEWCSDWHGPYANGAVMDPLGPSTGSQRVVRGGSWSSMPARLRSGYRACFNPENRLSDIGIRVVRSFQE